MQDFRELIAKWFTDGKPLPLHSWRFQSMLLALLLLCVVYTVQSVSHVRMVDAAYTVRFEHILRTSPIADDAFLFMCEDVYFAQRTDGQWEKVWYRIVDGRTHVMRDTVSVPDCEAVRLYHPSRGVYTE